MKNSIKKIALLLTITSLTVGCASKGPSELEIAQEQVEVLSAKNTELENFRNEVNLQNAESYTAASIQEGIDAGIASQEIMVGNTTLMLPLSSNKTLRLTKQVQRDAKTGKFTSKKDELCWGNC